MLWVPTQRCGGACSVVGMYGQPRDFVGAHDANRGRVWTPRRDIVGAHMFRVGVCGRVFLRTWTRTYEGKAKTPNPKGVEGELAGRLVGGL